MRWKRPTLYVIGEYRTVKRFLWFPVWLDDEVRWLEFARIVQQRVDFIHIIDVGMDVAKPGWKNVRWSN